MCGDFVFCLFCFFFRLEFSRVLYGSVFPGSAFLRESRKFHKGDVVLEPTGDGVKPESLCTLESGLAARFLGPLPKIEIKKKKKNQRLMGTQF